MNDTECAELIISGAIAKPDADIAGLGVIIAFIFSACITLVTVLAAYVFGLVDDGLLRPVDRLVLRAPSRAERHLQLHVTLRKVVLALSDQQIVTGIAILGAGFLGLRSGNMSVYHYQVVIYLAWMSSSVHLSALTLLRPFLLYHRGLLVWRITGMLTLLAMLFIALVPTVSNDWGVIIVLPDGWRGLPYSAFGVPAQCFWGRTYGDGLNPDAVLSYMVLFISYLWKLGGLFNPVRSSFERWIRNPLDWSLENILIVTAKSYDKHGGFVRLWAFRASLAIFLPVTASLESLGSFSAALWLSTLGLIYGVMQILIPRQLMQQVDPNLGGSEDQLGFGQMVPLILLIQPLGAATERLWVLKQGDKKDEEEEGIFRDPYWGTSNSWDVMNENNDIPPLPDSTILRFMTSYTSPPITESKSQRFQLRALVYTSKLFHLLIWITQAAIATTAGVALWLDWSSIGYTATGQWQIISIGIAGWFGLCPLVTLLLASWSRLGISYKRGETSSTSGTEDCDEAQVLHLQAMGHASCTEDKLTTPASAELSPKHAEAWAAEWRRRSIAAIESGEGHSGWRRRSIAQIKPPEEP